jgi:hypothetical protein
LVSFSYLHYNQTVRICKNFLHLFSK